MKSLLIVVLYLFANITLSAQVQNVKFDKEVYDFGKIIMDKPVSVNFTFTNKEKKPVLVQQATATCGCTTPTWPTKPVMPNKVGVIKAGFNAKAVGPFEKTITVQFQGNFVKEIRIKGEVLTAADFAKLKVKKVK